jgi:drug/metabolite transporter (DMT)-like permease
MTTVLCGLGAAVAFAISSLCSSRSSRMLGSWSVLSCVTVVGLVVVGPLALTGASPQGLDGRDAAWLAVAGATNVIGLLLYYTAFRLGKVGVVAPVVSTEGAIAALIAVLAGESLAPAAGGVLVLVVIGVVLAAGGRKSGGGQGAQNEPLAIVYAVAAAAVFGLSMYAMGRLGADLPLAWVLLPARVIGVVAIAVPLAIRGGLRITRAAAPLVVASGVCEMAGYGFFVLGARDGIAVSAVLASQFAAIAAVAGYVLFGERLARVQVAGVVTILVGVGALTALQA